MEKIDILPLTVDLIGVFFRSAKNALARAKHATIIHQSTEITGLNIFSKKHAESQAAVETVVASFLAIEATINFTFFSEINTHTNKSGLDKWLRKKWKRNLSISDKFLLLLHYSSTDLNKFQALTTLFHEFIILRNRIVHSYPEQYDALVEPSDIPNEVLIHAVDPCSKEKCFTYSKLSEEIGRINYEDAVRCYEIMLLIIGLIDGQFMLKLELSWYKDKEDLESISSGTLQEIIQLLEHRFYPEINPETFIWKIDKCITN